MLPISFSQTLAASLSPLSFFHTLYTLTHSELLLDKFRFEFIDFGDEFGLLSATLAGFSPFREDVLQFFHAHLLQIDRLPVNRLVCTTNYL